MAQSLTIFDLDHTLLHCNCSFKFGVYLYRRNYLSSRTMLELLGYYARHKWLDLSLNDLHSIIFNKLFIGKSLETVKKHAECFLTDALENMLHLPAWKRCEEARQRGDHLVLLSSSPQFLVEPIATRLEFHEWASTHYEIDKAERFVGISRHMLGEDKASYVKASAKRLGIASERIAAYSDSILDLPLLESVGRPVAVRPDRALRKLCLQKSWEIL